VIVAVAAAALVIVMVVGAFRSGMTDEIGQATFSYARLPIR
jgi:hypothetical protein